MPSFIVLALCGRRFCGILEVHLERAVFQSKPALISVLARVRAICRAQQSERFNVNVSECNTVTRTDPVKRQQHQRIKVHNLQGGKKKTFEVFFSLSESVCAHRFGLGGLPWLPNHPHRHFSDGHSVMSESFPALLLRCKLVRPRVAARYRQNFCAPHPTSTTTTTPTPSVCFTVNICRSGLWISVWKQHNKPADAHLSPSVCASSQQHLRFYQTKHESLGLIQALDT